MSSDITAKGAQHLLNLIAKHAGHNVTLSNSREGVDLTCHDCNEVVWWRTQKDPA